MNKLLIIKLEKSGDFGGYWYKCFPNVSPAFEIVNMSRKNT